MTIELINGMAYATLTQDQSQTDANAYSPLRYGTLGSTSSEEKLAQTFKPGYNKDIAAVDLSLRRNNSPVGAIWVEIWSVDGSSKPDALVSSEAVSNKIRTADIASGSSSDYRFYFPKGISLNTLYTYAIVLRGDYPINNNDYIKWNHYDTGSKYANGDGYKYSNSSGTWSPLYATNEDFYFKTYYADTTYPLVLCGPNSPPPNAEQPGEGHINILIPTFSVVAGDWTEYMDGGEWSYYYLQNTTTPAINDAVSWKVYLAAGTYTIYVIGMHGADRAKIGIFFNDEVDPRATIDWYNASSASNIRKSATGIVVGASGLVTLKIKVTDKNASSTNYYMGIEQIALVRTA